MRNLCQYCQAAPPTHVVMYDVWAPRWYAATAYAWSGPAHGNHIPLDVYACQPCAEQVAMDRAAQEKNAAHTRHIPVDK
jgi:hypothetical protein